MQSVTGDHKPGTCHSETMNMRTLNERGHLEARSLEIGKPERRGELAKMLVEELKR